MQALTSNISHLTVLQKFFVERAIELLYRDTIDSYRVRVKNPRTVMEEVLGAIESFEAGQLKHFTTICPKEKHQLGLKHEAEFLLESSPNYLIFQSFSQEYLKHLFREMKEENYKQIKNCLSILRKENRNYLTHVLDGLVQLIRNTPTTLPEKLQVMSDIDTTADILFSDLIDQGFSKGFLYRFVYSVFVDNKPKLDFDGMMSIFRNRVALVSNTYTGVFRIDTTSRVRPAVRSTQPGMLVTTDLSGISGINTKEFENFARAAKTRVFVHCKVQNCPDYLSALKKAKALLAENLDLLNLGFAGEAMTVHSRVLMIDEANNTGAQFQAAHGLLDGKYKVAARSYRYFTDQVPIILSNEKIERESKEKIKSAIRYLRLGNESTEIEHKFINYWIGLEYLFSSYESQNTISRVKTYLVACHSLVYAKRNLFEFHKNTIEVVQETTLAGINEFHKTDTTCLENSALYKEISTSLIDSYPLIAHRSFKLGLCVENGKKSSMNDYIERHQKNLTIHLTRIYRLRNEIIHDAATSIHNDQITANLRYYLTFMLNGCIRFLSENIDGRTSVEDFFTTCELYLGSMRHEKWPIKQVLNVPSAFDFIA